MKLLFEKAFAPETWANWALFLAAIVAGFIALKTLFAIHAEAVEIKKVAGAADKNAQALINSERPWITVTIRKIDAKGFQFVLKNIGGTPAEIRAVRGNPRVTDKGIDGGFTTEDAPDYGLPVQYRQVRLLAPNQEWILYDIDLSRRPYNYNPEEVKQLNDGRLHIFFAGVVIYRDTFRPDVEHETAFCYTYLSTPDEYHPSGPPQFTKYT